MFCSICGEKQSNLPEMRICRTCGILICPHCPSIGRLQNEIDGEPINHHCLCSSTDILPLENLRRHLVRDFLLLKQNISHITDIPVRFFQKLMEFRDALFQQGDTIVFLPEDYAFSGEISTTFATAEQFALEYLQDFSVNLRKLYSQLILNQTTMIDPEELQKIQMQLNILENKLKTFEVGLNSYFKSFQEELHVFHNKSNQALDLMITFEQEKHIRVQEFLNPSVNERLFHISSDISSNLTTLVERQTCLVVTTQKFMVLKEPKLSLRSKTKVLISLSPHTIQDIKLFDRRLRNPKLEIHASNQILRFSGEKQKLEQFEKMLTRFKYGQVPSTPRNWKNWKINWSAERYTSLIDRLLQFNSLKQRKNLSNLKYHLAGTAVNLTDKQQMMLEYVDSQLEKNSQQIRIAEYIINDLNSRKNTMTINEYYGLFENFSMKLQELELNRNNLLGQYEQFVS